MNINFYEKQFESALLNMDREKVFNIISAVLKKCDSTDFIEKIMVHTLVNIGKGWEDDKISLAQVYMSGKICEEAVDKILLSERKEKNSAFKIAIATLEDHHTLGKRIVKSMVISSGYSIIDYGHGIDVDSLVQKVIQDKIDILLISVLMYSSALKIKNLQETFKKYKYHVKVLVGGAPFTFDKQLWKNVNADAAGEDASDAVYYIKKWTEDDSQYGK